MKTTCATGLCRSTASWCGTIRWKKGRRKAGPSHWYLGRVLTRGRAADLQAVGLDVIAAWLPDLQLDFAQDSPYRLQTLTRPEGTDMPVESLLEIACNKLSELFDRAEPKDFVDVYFICQEVLPFEELAAAARQKHAGMDDYWLAVALQQVERIEHLPEMIRPLDLAEMQRFFLEIARQLLDGYAGAGA
jgi:hypothetical protein